MKALYFVLLCGALALVVAGFLYRAIKQQDTGNERMREIAGYIREGAMAFLAQEYRTIAIFAGAMALVLFLAVDLATAVCFLLGAMLSVLAGYFGMSTATLSNVRTTAAAQKGSMGDALRVAFKGGAVMGLCVVGLGVGGLAALMLVMGVENVAPLTGFGLGASSIALFGRVGGGIYTKAADVGADLMGKVEAGIPEDDPRNPAVIADNVGDNVGDVAGMGSDLFESYVGSIISAITLAVALPALDTAAGIAFPLLLAGAGILAAVIAIILVSAKSKKDVVNPSGRLNMGTYVSSLLLVVVSFFASRLLFGGWQQFAAVASGVVVGVLIGALTEYYTSDKYKPVKDIAKQCEVGAAPTVLRGFSVGMLSTAGPILLIVAGILLAYLFAGLYGIAIAAVGMLATVGVVIAVDAYGPIADNAGGIAQMSELPKEVREITDKLDSVGNTTAAIGKGFAIGSAALTALALLVSYAQTAGITSIDLLDPKVIAGLLFGGMLPFLFSALTMSSVTRAAYEMIEEVRHQFKQKPGIMKGEDTPDYARCVAISTAAALKEMLVPGLLAVACPVAIGLLLGPQALGGMLAGALVTGVLLALTMSNAGGAWDNAKKFIEEGHHGGKGSEAHKAAVVGDTVGDPFKDTSGPSINILIKLMTIVALVFLPLIL